jgi:hypothetical protein
MECKGKKLFETKSIAQIRVNEINQENRENKDRTHLRYYKCSICGGFHLSSLKKEEYKHRKKLKNPEYRAEIRTKRLVKIETEYWEDKFGVEM